jgi:hypothetical protein
MVDRPYLFSAVVLARAGNAAKARAMIARYRTEMTDTSIRRAQEAELHSALGEIALADRKPLDALVEFRRGDVGYDGLPASECAPCLPFDLARAFDAAGKLDSAAVMFRRYLSTLLVEDRRRDGSVRPAVHERLGQLYESMGYGKAVDAIEHSSMWKNADPELQPRVAGAQASRAIDAGGSRQPRAMPSDPTALNQALADRYIVEHEIGRGGMATCSSLAICGMTGSSRSNC